MGKEGMCGAKKKGFPVLILLIKNQPPMTKAISQDYGMRKVDNLGEYLYLKYVRANTGLIGGRIYFEGRFFEKDVYDLLYPEPVLKYKVVQLDGTQIAK